MLRWNNDYNRVAHPDLLRALTDHNEESYGGYGLDDMCEKARRAISKHLEKEDAAIHFLVGGTQVNYTLIAAALRPYQSVISADSGHINVHETGAVENTGHKILSLPSENGKISADAIAREATQFAESDVQEHITEPKLIYLSFPTEYGTLYSRKELTEIRRIADRYGLYLFVDGARLAYGLCAEENDVSLADLASLCDAFYIGGTKCGAMMGEALVITNDELKKNFRSYMKQNGAMLAKGFALGIQFYALFEKDLYFAIGKKAVNQAMRIRKAFRDKGIPFYVESPTNQQFVVLSDEEQKILSRNHIFQHEARIDDTHSAVRFCTSFNTKDAEVDQLISDISAL